MEKKYLIYGLLALVVIVGFVFKDKLFEGSVKLGKPDFSNDSNDSNESNESSTATVINTPREGQGTSRSDLSRSGSSSNASNSSGSSSSAEVIDSVKTIFHRFIFSLPYTYSYSSALGFNTYKVLNTPTVLDGLAIPLAASKVKDGYLYFAVDAFNGNLKSQISNHFINEGYAVETSGFPFPN